MAIYELKSDCINEIKEILTEMGLGLGLDTSYLDSVELTVKKN